MTSLRDMLHGLETLDRKALRQLRAAIDNKLSASPDDADDSDLVKQVLSAICSAVKPHCFCSPAILRGNASFASFKAKLFSDELAAQASADGVALDTWLSRSHVSRVVRQAILRYGYTVMLDELRRRGLVVDGVMLMNNTHRLPAYIDRSFPGYAANGTLDMLFRREASEPVTTASGRLVWVDGMWVERARK